MPARIIFVTGTDTGVGKTVFTALMLAHLRARNVHALALKPFCCGGRSDPRVLHSLQADELSLEQVNPYWFSEPVAPVVAAQQEGRSIRFHDVCEHITKAAARCDCLLVEGIGGLLVPLAKSYTLLDLITAFRAFVVVVARNKLGTLNHSLLTLRGLGMSSEQRPRKPPYAVVLMGQRTGDASAASNAGLLRELTGHGAVTSIPYLGAHPLGKQEIMKNRKKIQKTLARIFQISSVVALFFVS